jgi:hypothetical protein
MEPSIAILPETPPPGNLLQAFILGHYAFPKYPEYVMVSCHRGGLPSA